MVVIPSFLSDGSGSGDHYDGDAFNNVRLRMGEVQEIIYPNDPRSLSKRIIEFDVLVQHLSNGTAVAKIYKYCTVSNLFGGIADKVHYTLRPDKGAATTNSTRRAGPGIGSKVLILCISGSHYNAKIIGGVDDTEDAADPNEGHFYHARFNGIDLAINNDGELTLTYQGAMKADATPAEGVDSNAVGTTVKIQKSGNFVVSDGSGKNTITLDHSTGKISITSENQVVVDSAKVSLGSAGASEPAVKGNAWKALMQNMLELISTHIHPTPTGPAGPTPFAPAFQALKAQLQAQLSTVVFEE